MIKRKDPQRVDWISAASSATVEASIPPAALGLPWARALAECAALLDAHGDDARVRAEVIDLLTLLADAAIDEPPPDDPDDGWETLTFNIDPS